MYFKLFILLSLFVIKPLQADDLAPIQLKPRLDLFEEITPEIFEDPLIDFTPPKPEVSQAELSIPSVDATGILTEANGGMPNTLWQKTSFQTVLTSLERIPSLIPSPTLRLLLEKLLLTAAPPPLHSEETSFLFLRAEKLAAVSQIESAIALLESVPLEHAKGFLAYLKTQLYWQRGDLEKGCREVFEIISFQSSPYFQRALIFCQAYKGHLAEALTSLELLKEGVGSASSLYPADSHDPAFQGLMQRYLNLQTEEPLHFETLTLLDSALLKNLSLSVPGETLDKLSLPLLSALALSANQAPELRLEAAIKAGTYDALTHLEILSLYENLPLKEQEQNNSLPLMKHQAAAYQDFLKAQDLKERLIQAYAFARPAKQSLLTLALYREMLEDIQPTPFMLEGFPDAYALAALATRAYLLVDPEKASTWLALSEATALTQNQPDLLLLKALFSLKRPQNPLPNLKEWYREEKAQNGAEPTLKKALLLYSFFDALDAPLEGPLETLLEETNQIPLNEAAETVVSSLELKRLKMVAQDQRLGETLLIALSLLKDPDLAKNSEIVLEAIIKAFLEVGLTQEAFQLALEYLIASGI